MRKLAYDVMSAIPHKDARTRASALLTGDWETVFAGVNPSSYTSAREYLEAAQVSALVRKLPGLAENGAAYLRQKAVETFWSCEETCKDTNDRLAYYVNLIERPFFEDEADQQIYELLMKMRRKAQRILGPVPKEIVPSFSGGSSFLNVAKKNTLPHKLLGECAVTERLYDVFRLIIGKTAWEALTWSNGLIKVRGNRFETVPKDSEKDRGIGVEPLGNVALQLPLGKHIRRRLLRVAGLDIANDRNHPHKGQNLHRRMAQWASVDGDYATIDLSNASDTVAYMLCKLLLPSDWFELLCLVRSPETRVDGKWVKLQKFSSMGNGFTFELETLLFYAICSTVCGTDAVAVYGDDMLVPTDSVNDVHSALRFFGFTVNTKKSFHDGPFRESCGGDFFNGESVRPIFLKKAPENPIEWIELHNRLVEVEKLLSWDLASPKRKIILNCIPQSMRLYGPQGVEGVLWTDDRDKWKVRPAKSPGWALPPFERPAGYFELQVNTLLPETFRSWKNTNVALVCALLGVSSTGADVARSVAGFRRKWISLPEL